MMMMRMILGNWHHSAGDDGERFQVSRSRGGRFTVRPLQRCWERTEDNELNNSEEEKERRRGQMCARSSRTGTRGPIIRR